MIIYCKQCKIKSDHVCYDGSHMANAKKEIHKKTQSSKEIYYNPLYLCFQYVCGRQLCCVLLKKNLVKLARVRLAFMAIIMNSTRQTEWAVPEGSSQKPIP